MVFVGSCAKAASLTPCDSSKESLRPCFTSESRRMHELPPARPSKRHTCIIEGRLPDHEKPAPLWLRADRVGHFSGTGHLAGFLRFRRLRAERSRANIHL